MLCTANWKFRLQGAVFLPTLTRVAIVECYAYIHRSWMELSLRHGGVQNSKVAVHLSELQNTTAERYSAVFF